MKLISPFALAALLGSATAFGCSQAKEEESLGVSDAPLTSTPSADEHLLVLVSYENGVFKGESVKRVPGVVREPRSGRHHGGLRYTARTGTSSLRIAGAPDLRKVHVEYMDPTTGKMRREEHDAPGKRHLLIHVPSSAEAVDFFETASFEAASGSSSRTLNAAAPPPPSLPLGSISLKGLL